MQQLLSLPLVLLLSGLSLVFAVPCRAAKVDFSRQIQPLFARHCYKCHGPNNAEGGLRLSNGNVAKAELESGATAVVAGDPHASALLARVASEDESLRMPPEGKGLSAEEVALLERWVAEGAPWADHWSFQPIERPVVPTTRNRRWGSSPIDAFILRQLARGELAPAAPADKRTLIRRAYYDLVGLPPTFAQIEEFISDDSPGALENVIDTLLASRQYGEKWARHWLDLVRYAETNGYERDGAKDLIWKYRDYVIRALNDDKPFDRFVLEQLAGDELEDMDAESITATGYYRLGLWDDEPADRELARYDYLDDILRTTGEGLLGMTIGCARCHDHKIDPILQSDYYSMLSFFSDISAHGKGVTNHVPVVDPDQYQEFEQSVAEKKARQAELEAEIQQIEHQLVEAARALNPKFELEIGGDQSTVVIADSIRTGQIWKYTESPPGDHWFQIAFDDDHWAAAPGGFGRRGTPGPVLRTEWHSADIWMRKDFRLARVPAGKMIIKIYHDDDATVFLNGKQILTLGGHNASYDEVDVTEQAKDVWQTGRNTLAIHCHQAGGGQYIDVGLIIMPMDPIGSLMHGRGNELIGPATVQEWTQKKNELAKSKSTHLEFTPNHVMAVAEDERRKTWILGRGLPALKGDLVEPRFPLVLNPPQAKVQARTNSSGKRLALAKWITSRDNPLTARVIANRVWQHHFGRGIVRTSSDFGYQGTPPTHPELLDWLAAELIDSGWSLKQFHKTIMLSSAYQMGSSSDERAIQVDPTNDLFWRFNMRRLTAEEIRDSILTVTDTLNSKMYGPPIFPKLSREVLATASMPGRAWGNSPIEEGARRTIYVHVKRSLRPPMLANFDVPDTDSPCAVRLTTTVPTQALGMLNSEFLNTQAERLAERVAIESSKDLEDQVAAAIRLLTGRVPSEEEIEADTDFFNELKLHENLDSARALSVYCLMLLNTNEFIYVD
ncbi:MAG: PSD1 and planctomycete cytochrome C domain-containing protein [Pirellulales bacterium]|nr:PSD1 and planctomycete cytochrome C domain-containing protein [Pirellulales bacterium]